MFKHFFIFIFILFFIKTDIASEENVIIKFYAEQRGYSPFLLFFFEENTEEELKINKKEYYKVFYRDGLIMKIEKYARPRVEETVEWDKDGNIIKTVKSPNLIQFFLSSKSEYYYNQRRITNIQEKISIGNSRPTLRLYTTNELSDVKYSYTMSVDGQLKREGFLYYSENNKIDSFEITGKDKEFDILTICKYSDKKVQIFRTRNGNIFEEYNFEYNDDDSIKYAEFIVNKKTFVLFNG